MNKTYFQALSVMIGYVIGVGMFGLPFLIARSGVLIFMFYILLFGAVQYLLHLTYANMVVVTKEYHRLPGYVGKYLGKSGKTIVFVAKMCGNYGALLAYIIITGIFANELLGGVLGGSEFLYASIIFGFSALVVFFGIKMIAKVELFMTVLLLSVVVMIGVKGKEAIDISNLSNLADWKYLFLPFGATLMAIDGNGSIPIIVKLLKKNKRRVKSVVFWGTLIPVIITILFTFVIVGISGAGTTPDALVGIRRVLDDGVIFFSLIFGVLTMTTSMILVSESIRETLWWDYKFDKNIAWALAVFIPYGFYMLGFRNLTAVVSLAGGVAGGLSAVMLITVFLKLKKKKENLALFERGPANIIIYLLLLLFFCGIIYEFYYFIFN